MICKHIVKCQIMLRLFVKHHSTTRQTYGDYLRETPCHLLLELIGRVRARWVQVV